MSAWFLWPLTIIPCVPLVNCQSTLRILPALSPLAQCPQATFILTSNLVQVFCCRAERAPLRAFIGLGPPNHGRAMYHMASVLFVGVAWLASRVQGEIKAAVDSGQFELRADRLAGAEEQVRSFRKGLRLAAVM